MITKYVSLINISSTPAILKFPHGDRDYESVMHAHVRMVNGDPLQYNKIMR